MANSVQVITMQSVVLTPKFHNWWNQDAGNKEVWLQACTIVFKTTPGFGKVSNYQNCAGQQRLFGKVGVV